MHFIAKHWHAHGMLGEGDYTNMLNLKQNFQFQIQTKSKQFRAGWLTGPGSHNTIYGIMVCSYSLIKQYESPALRESAYMYHRCRPNLFAQVPHPDIWYPGWVDDDDESTGVVFMIVWLCSSSCLIVISVRGILTIQYVTDILQYILGGSRIS